jgi:pyrimidine-nucleoside phosphorylase
LQSIVELIATKRDGGELGDDAIRWLIAEYAVDRVPAYQMAALAMAVCCRGLTDRETETWTDAMLRSGRVLDFSDLGSGRVDKHSTGGVGDKISLPLAPAAAACGCIVPMVAGRGLGHTGGTVDKLEAIPGYRTDLSVEEFRTVLAAHGAAIIGQTADIAPADKRLYALRDVTGTVESIPLICASIMSKKMAEGIEGLVLDIKVGPAAFMRTVDDARRLSERMVAVGERMGKRVIAFLTRMEAPLGLLIGNAAEVEESLQVLDGGGPADVVELVETLGGAMVELARGVDFETGRKDIAASLKDGRARARFDAMVKAQGGDLAGLPRHSRETLVVAGKDGIVGGIDGREVGLVAVQLGAGRQRQDDVIDPIMGIRIEAPVGTEVRRGQPLATVLHGEENVASAPLERLARAFDVGNAAPTQTPLIIERIG